MTRVSPWSPRWPGIDDVRRVRLGADGDARHGARPLCRSLRGGAVADLDARAASSSPATPTTPRRSSRCRSSAIAQPDAGDRDRPRLALRPLPGDALGDGARAADRVHAGAARGAGRRPKNADAAFAAFDRFLARLPAGVQLFSMLSSNPGLLGLLATMMATAPRLAETVVHRAACPRRADRAGLLRPGARTRRSSPSALARSFAQARRLRGRARPRPHLRRRSRPS